MKKVKLFGLNLAITIIGLNFCGCAGLMNAEIYHDQNIQKGGEIIYSPPLNTPNKIEVGENMFSKAYLRDEDTYTVTLLEDAETTFIGQTWDLKANSKELLLKWNGINTICNYRASGVEFCLGDPQNSGIFTTHGRKWNPNDWKLDKPAKYKIERTTPSMTVNPFKLEALYEGKSENKINISFREFKNDMARPAFTQDIKYELDKNGETFIGFKGLRIKVLKATNTDITYLVQQGYK